MTTSRDNHNSQVTAGRRAEPTGSQQTRRRWLRLAIALPVLIGASLVTVGCRPLPPVIPLPTVIPQPSRTPSAEPSTAVSPTASADPTLPTTAGSLPVGQARYAIPAGAVFVDQATGSDSNNGTVSAPKRTIRKALEQARGGTVVVRAGNYFETVLINEQYMAGSTIQNYPGEAVWLDGSTPVSGWTAATGAAGRSVWRARWTVNLDASPTYTRGVADNTAEGWAFVNPDRPMAAHPDQVWLGGRELTEVATLAEVGPGTFWIDDAADQLYLGSNPAGQEVRATGIPEGAPTVTSTKGPFAGTYQRAIAVQIATKNVTIRGLGVRRYGTSVPDMGTIRIDGLGSQGPVENPAAHVLDWGRGARLENLVVEDNATQGVSAGAADVSLVNLTARNNGLAGVSAGYADNLRLLRVVATGNNTEQFNHAPVAAGVKITRLRDAVISDSSFDNNNSTGLWLDESAVGVTITGNTMRGNEADGLVVEISQSVIVANNIVTNNTWHGINVFNSALTKVWNNTIGANHINLVVQQDSRRPVAGIIDPRRPEAYCAGSAPQCVTYAATGVEIINNRLEAPVNQGLTWDDGYNTAVWWTSLRLQNNANSPVSKLELVVNGNDLAATPERRLVRWQPVSGGPATDYSDEASFRQATGQQRDAVVPISAEIAAAVDGLEVGQRVVGPV
ncbi:MAG: right-handed parallel beta-helix repeat-containing protein [Propionibacteriaceae bacterium]|jgi:parallel beta-helix repeat protein|nr:right-handed parallel beta-helix repeat-containing protein [Propionibacteriaceae bacterium]